jgi:hypothetical protein
LEWGNPGEKTNRHGFLSLSVSVWPFWGWDCLYFLFGYLPPECKRKTERELTEEEQQYIVEVIGTWLSQEDAAEKRKTDNAGHTS